MDNKKSLIKKILIAIGLFLFILLCASQKQASALVYKGQVQTQVSGNNCLAGNQCSGAVNSGKQDITINYEYTPHLNQQYDLVSLQFTRFAINFEDSTSQNITDYCNGSLNTQGQTNNLSLTCTTGSPGHDIEYLPDSRYFSLYAFATYESGSISHCWQSAEVNDSFMCPMYRNDPLTKITLRLNTNSPVPFTYSIDVNTYKLFYNYDSTDIINSNGQIVSQQQQTNDILSGSDVSASSSQGTSFITDSSSSLSSDFDTLTGEGNLVGIVQTFFTQIENSTCEPIVLPIPYTNQNITLPCLGTELQNRVPLLWTLYTTIITGVLVFRFWYYAIDMIKHIFDPYSTGLSGVTDIAGGGK